MPSTGEIVDADGHPLSGEELEDYCKKRGLCPLCARVRTRKRVFKLFKKNKWEVLTVQNKNGDYLVYKGYCVKPQCFTLDQAKRLAGEGGDSQRLRASASRSRSLTKDAASAASSTRDMSPDSVDGAVHKRIANAFPPPELKQNATEHIDGDKTKPLVVVQTTADAVRRDPSITVLDLSNVKLSHLDLATLSTALQANTSLHSLILENCSMDDEGVEFLSDGLFEAKDIPLNKLYLRTNFIKNPGVDALCRFLEANVTLEKLDLSRNSISTRGGVAVFNAFHRNKLSRIRCLNLSHNELWDLDEENFGVRALLSKNRTLRILNLEGNYIHDGGASSLAKGIGKNENTAIERLYLGWNGVGDDGTIALAKMLQTNTTLRVLGLGENEISNAGARALLAAMDVNTTVREISGLWRNQIDRRFMIVAIRRLLLSHEKAEQKTMASIHDVEQAPASMEFGALHKTEDSTRSSEFYKMKQFGENPEGRFNESRMSAFDCDGLGGKRPSGIGSEIATQESKMSVFESTIPEAESLHGASEREQKFLVEQSVEPLYEAAADMEDFTRANDFDARGSHADMSRAEEPGNLFDTTSDVKNTTPNHLRVEQGSYDLDRLTVFQSAPLAYLSLESSVHHRIPLRDYEHELKTIEESVFVGEGKNIEVTVEPSTTDRFATFFSGSTSRVLHLSCHGNRSYLTFENGHGALEQLPLDSLRNLVRAGSGNCKILFVSSFHARLIGNAFVEAGIQHVVCCHHEEMFRDPVALDFAQSFYVELANNKSLTQAYATALETVRTSQRGKTTRLLLERFSLLPEKAPGDPYHDIPVFFTDPVAERDSFDEPNMCTSDLPPVPEQFIGREVDMFEILEALRADDVVRVGGSPGSGKDSIVAAVCRYILQRQDSFQIEDVFWLPPPDGVVLDKDSLYGDLCLAVDLMKDAEEDVWEDEENLECRERIELELEGKKSILVIDDRKFSYKSLQENLESFVSHLLNGGDAKVILISSRTSDEISTLSESTASSRPEETAVEIAPLDFKSSALLFGGISKFVCSSGCPAAHSAQEFAELFEPPFISKLPENTEFLPSRRRLALFSRLGSGRPASIIKAATGVSKKDFIELIGIANRPEVYVDSLGALETEISRRSTQKEKAITEKNYLRALDLEKILAELQGLRSKFPTLDELRRDERAMKKELSEAVASRQYDSANELKRDLLDLKKRIMKEQRNMTRQNVSPNGRLNEIQAHVQSIIQEDFMNSSFGKSRSATFVVNCEGRDCSFVIYFGSVLEFEHLSEAMGIVCWTNESCILEGNPAGEEMLKCGGSVLEEDIACLPAIAGSPWGPVRCGTGNAVIVGPENYGNLNAPCVILTVGPVSPSNDDDIEADDGDTLHYVITMLRSCYRSSLVLVKHAQLQAVALTMLTTRETGTAYKQTLRVGLKTLVEEVQFSQLRDLHIVASSPQEASTLIDMATEMGLRRA